MMKKLLIASFAFLFSVQVFAQTLNASSVTLDNDKLPARAITESINIYPTPTQGPLNVKIENGSGPVVIEVFDMLGNRVESIRFERKSKGLYAADLSSINKGFYFVKIQTSEQFITRRITVVQ